MTREEKTRVIEGLTKQLNENEYLYLVDASGLNAVATSGLRRECFKKNIQLIVVKNMLLKKAMDKSNKDLEELAGTLQGSTAIMFTETGNLPAKVIKEFRKNFDKPLIKGAYIEETTYIGDDKLEMLTNIKSKNELIADVVAALQSPAKNVVSALQSGGGILTGVLKTLAEKAE
ncbi:MAG: 50S ribosomal protein L10 [Bacteroidota bacterium]|nr:50S ribosomal protein L10 [Bacteroidota bacterium]